MSIYIYEIYIILISCGVYTKNVGEAGEEENV